jgi:hypothetical protein
MTTRELFEAAFPVPDGAVWDCVLKKYRSTSSPMARDGTQSAAIRLTEKWIGFQAGYKTGKENTNA